MIRMSYNEFEILEKKVCAMKTVAGRFGLHKWFPTKEEVKAMLPITKKEDIIFLLWCTKADFNLNKDQMACRKFINRQLCKEVILYDEEELIEKSKEKDITTDLTDTSNKILTHSITIARRMKDLAIEKPEKYPVNPEDAFVLGLTHNIGCEFTQNKSEQAKVGGEILMRQGYKYWKEVYYCGIPQGKYSSPMLDLLNYADMTTDIEKDLTFVKNRINNMANRCEEDLE